RAAAEDAAAGALGALRLVGRRHRGARARGRRSDPARRGALAARLHPHRGGRGGRGAAGGLMVDRIGKHMGAEALRAATGRTHAEWRELLEGAGALEWSHKQTAEWLVREHGVDGWWAQGITVDFEQDRKGRLPGQQADGSFSVSKTRTIAGERLE